MKSAGPHLDFTIEEYNRRLESVRQAMETARLDLLLVHSLTAIYYLTGFETVAHRCYCCLIISKHSPPTFVTERDEQYNAATSSWLTDIVTYTRWEDPVALTANTVRRRGSARQRVGLELRSRYLSYEQGKQLHNLLDSHEMVDGTDIVPSCMLLKSDAELNYIRKAALYTQSGMQAAIDALAVGATDNSVAAEAYHAIVAAGSEYMSSDPIVCAGANSAVPHGHFSNRHVAAGDIVLLELSGCAGRYSAPLMRAVSMGPADSRVRTAAETCREALEEILSAMAPGRPFSDAARRGRAVIEKAGPNMIFHGTYAYSIGAGFPGVSWADAPVEVRDDSRGQFESGMVLHMPISLRLRGEFGVAISETVAITAQGLEVVTQFERQLFVR